MALRWISEHPKFMLKLTGIIALIGTGIYITQIRTKKRPGGGMVIELPNPTGGPITVHCDTDGNCKLLKRVLKSEYA